MASEIDETTILEFLRQQEGRGAESLAPPVPFDPREAELAAPGIGGQPPPALAQAQQQAAGLPPLTPQRPQAGARVPAGLPDPIRQALANRKQALIDAQFQERPPKFSDEKKRLAANVAATGVIGIATGPQGLAVRAGAQFAGAALTEFAVRRAQGDSFKEAAINALQVGGLDAALEAGAGIPGKAVGLGVRAGRAGLDKANRLIRKATDLPLPPEKVRSQSIRAPFAHRMDPGAREVVEETERLATKEGISAPLTPGQLVDSSGVDQLENIAASAAFSAGKIADARKVPIRLNREALEELVASFPEPTAEELRDILNVIGEGRLKELTGLARGMFDTLDERLGDIFFVDIAPFKEALRKKLKGHSGGILPEQFAKVQRILDKGNTVAKAGTIHKGKLLEADTIIEGNTIRFADAQEIRANLHVLSKQFGGEAVLTAERGLAKWAAGQFKNIMDTAVKDLAPDLVPIAKEANRLWREEVRGELTTIYLKKLADQSPETVVNALVKGEQPGFTRLVRSIVTDGDPSGKAWEKVQGAWFKDLMWDAADAAKSGDLAVSGERVVRGSRILELAKTRASADDPSLHAMFPGREGQKKIRQFLLNARGMARAEAEAGGKGTGTIWFAMQTAGAFGLVASVPGDLVLHGELTGAGGAALAGSVGILMAPRVIANILKSSIGSRWLSVGLGAPKGSRAGRRAILGLTGYLLREKLLEPEEEVKAKELFENTRRALRQWKGARSNNAPDFSRELGGASQTAIP